MRTSFCLVLLGALGIGLHGQTGSIQGTLTDPSNAAIPNAKAVAIDESKQIVARETTTATDGTFALRPLRPGRYTVKAEAAGFKALERKELVLDQNQALNLGAVTLQAGQVSDSVLVEAQVPMVETATAQKSFVIDARQVTQLALNGRDFQSLIKTLPGIVSSDRSDFRLAFRGTHFYLGRGYLTLGNPKAAILALERARANRPEEAQIDFQLSRAYTAAGQTASARVALDRFKKARESHRAAEREALVLR